MIKFNKVASAAATALATTSFLLAYGVTTAASAQTQSSYEAPVIVAPAVATTVEPGLSNSDQSADAAADDIAPASLADLVDDWQEAAPLDAEARCLATAVFYEARSEALAGQLAVAHVVIGRARSGRFPTSLCGVVTQRGQFGFVRNGRMPDQPAETSQWRTAKAIAQIALGEDWENPVKGALYFHAARVAPGWGHERVARIGNHVFYR